MAEKPFQRGKITWPARCAIGIATDVIAAPLVWATDKFGRGDALFARCANPRRSGWRSQQREMDEYFTAELHRFGSDFPYEEFCDVSPAG